MCKREAQHKPGVCEAKHTDKTNKRVQRGKGTRIEALHKPGVYEAKHTDKTNKRVQKGKGTEDRSTAQTRCLRGEAHRQNK